MKKLSLTLVITLLFTIMLYTNTFALNVGNKLGDVINTDIQTYINGEQIPCYNINDKSVVLVADLKNYGFDVVYDDATRTSTVTRSYNKPFTPIQDISNNIAKVGRIAFSYLYTDISAILDGKRVDSFNVQGKLAIFFGDLKDYGTFSWDSNARQSKLTLYKTPVTNAIPSNEPQTETSSISTTPSYEPKITAPGEGIREDFKKYGYAFNFKRNSANGIVVTWCAKNNTGKEIKYYTLNFSMWNPVGDPAPCQIKKTHQLSQRFVGPVPIDAMILCFETLIGYSSACSKIVLETIDLEYMDGTTETIIYGYSVSR